MDIIKSEKMGAKGLGHCGLYKGGFYEEIL
jgi:hypothetical protein